MEAFLEKAKATYDPKEYALVLKAFDYSRNAHADQKRSSGEAYFVHPLEVARILLDLDMDVETICATLLHDVVEDTDCTLDILKNEFGPVIAELVDGVTKLEKMGFNTREEQQAENVRKMLLGMARDIRVVFIKLADRLHNMRTLQYVSEEQRQRVAKETLEIYSPLASRLGIFKIKGELEDLALSYTSPKEYRELVEKLEETLPERNKNISLIIGILREKLNDIGVEAELEGRVKQYYSIYKKMAQRDHAFDEVYDLTAIRVIVKTVQDCYTVLGMVHTEWKPIDGRFKDYIAMPKANGYQSLHTTLIGLRGVPFEVQIRTVEMHQVAEYGVAAHWKYKENIHGATALDDRLHWVRQIVEAQTEMKDATEFVENMKADLFADEVFVFTPKGDVIELPKGATTLDFAYAIHSQVGNRCVGAKISGKIVPLGTELKNGDIVEVITSANSKGPSRDWLNIVFTSQAKVKIRTFFKKEFREENIVKGREMLDREARRLGFTWQHLSRNEWLEPLFKKYTLGSMDDLFSAVGYGGLTTGQILQKLADEFKRTVKPERTEKALEKAAEVARAAREKISGTSGNGVLVKGEPNMVVRFAHCCTPVLGDEIVGYTTRGRGVSIHRKDCSNLKDMTQQPERFIEVSWEGSAHVNYTASIQVISRERIGLMGEVARIVDEMKLEITALNARKGKPGTSIINLTLDIENTEQLEHVMRKIRRLPEVVDVFRVSA